MATDFGSANGTAWNTSNMKPEPDDQIDALWGQNIADDLAYIAYKPKIAIQMGPSSIWNTDNQAALLITGTQQFLYDDNYGTLCGTYNFSQAGGIANGGDFDLYMDVGTVIKTTTDISNTRLGFRQTISHFPTGSVNKPIDISFKLAGTKQTAAVTTFTFNGLTAWFEI